MRFRRVEELSERPANPKVFLDDWLSKVSTIGGFLEKLRALVRCAGYAIQVSSLLGGRNLLQHPACPVWGSGDVTL